MAGGRSGDGQQQQQQQGSSRGGDLQQVQGARLDFAPNSARDLEVNTSARAQADKSTLKVCIRYIMTSMVKRRHLRSTYPMEASTLSSLAMPPISR